MYVPPAFREDDPSELRRIMREARLSTLVTATTEGLIATPLPLILDESEGEHGVLHGHLAKANPQWKLPASGEALVIFSGPDAYVSPSWYPSKREHGKVVPPWSVTDAPEAFVKAQLKGIVGLRLPITRIEGKRKMSQNRNADDRDGVAEGLLASDEASDQVVSRLIPRQR
jgi:transcriptional regulator